MDHGYLPPATMEPPQHGRPALQITLNCCWLPVPAIAGRFEAMIDIAKIREVLNRKMEKDRRYGVDEIYGLIPQECLDEEDWLPSYPNRGSDVKWKRQVRNALRIGKDKCHLDHPNKEIYIRRRMMT